MLIQPMRMLGVALGMAQRATASGARLLEILDREPEIVSGSVALPEGRGRVELRDVTFGYGDGPDALRHVDLTVDAGSTMARVGATGSGKTTLVQLLPRLYDPRSGSVHVDGADVRDVDIVALRRAIAVVDDDPFLFSDTIAGNIAYARPDAASRPFRCSDTTARTIPAAPPASTRGEIARGARRAQAAGFIDELTDG